MQREWAAACPKERQTASEAIGRHLVDYIMATYRPNSRYPPALEDQISAMAPTVSDMAIHRDEKISAAYSPLLLCGYLPLKFEVDLIPALRHLWRSASNLNIRIFTPVVLPRGKSLGTGPLHRERKGQELREAPPRESCSTNSSGAKADPLSSAMLFVEVFDEADLVACFSDTGSYGVPEFNWSMLQSLFSDPAAINKLGNSEMTIRPAPQSCPATHDDAAAHDASSTSSTRVRHVLLCDGYDALFPESQSCKRPPGLLEYASGGSSATKPSPGRCHHMHQTGSGAQMTAAGHLHALPTSLEDASLVVLTPGVLFDVSTGARLGKGGGFYDRFLGYHRRCRSAVLTDGCPSAAYPALPRGRGGDDRGGPFVPKWDVIGVAFDAQVVRSKGDGAAKLPVVEGLDEAVHAVVSPDQGVERVGRGCDIS